MLQKSFVAITNLHKCIHHFCKIGIHCLDGVISLQLYRMSCGDFGEKCLIAHSLNIDYPAVAAWDTGKIVSEPLTASEGRVTDWGAWVLHVPAWALHVLHVTPLQCTVTHKWLCWVRPKVSPVPCLRSIKDRCLERSTEQHPGLFLNLH